MLESSKKHSRNNKYFTMKVLLFILLKINKTLFLTVTCIEILHYKWKTLNARPFLNVTGVVSEYDTCSIKR